MVTQYRQPVQALILAGGMGTRLGPLTAGTPKPLLDVGGLPFINYLLWNLKRNGIRDIIVSVGYLAREIITVLTDGSDLGIRLTYSIETEPLGTGGALKLAQNLLDEAFFVLNGDTLFDIDYADLGFCLTSDVCVALALREVEDTSRYGRVLLDEGRVMHFSEKNLPGQGYVNGGVYAMRKRVLDRIPPGRASLETDLFPDLAGRNHLGARVYHGFFLDIGLPLTYKEAQTVIPGWKDSMIRVKE
ncbi:MAG: nucleotidyltransferase family protein [Pseudomonadota bacterium]